MRGTLIYNYVNLADFGVYYDGSQEFAKPAKEVERISIAGRSGDLLIPSNRWENLPLSFNCYIRENFRGNYDALVSFLNSVEGYARLETSGRPDVYREAAFVVDITPKTGQFNRDGRFALQFDCKPQMWLKSGETPIEVTGSATIYNPTPYTAKPIIEVAGTGEITVNTTQITLTANTSMTTINCDIENAYENGTNRNGDLILNTGDFPVLSPGYNNIALGAGMTAKILPRWWQI